jgi:hypothetical protein
MASDAVLAKEEAIALVASGMNPEWCDDALIAIKNLALREDEFTTDKVWEELGTFSTAATPEPRAMGAVMVKARKLGYVVPTNTYLNSSRVSCHNRPLRIWKSNLK